MRNASSSKVRGISYIVIAFLFGYQLRATYDFNTNVQFNTGTKEVKDILIEYQKDQLVQLQIKQNSSTPNQQLQETQTVYLTKASRPDFSKKDVTKCDRQWDWPFLDVWGQEISDSEDETVTKFLVARSNAHNTARGSIDMKVIQRKTQNIANNNPTRVVIFVSHQDTMGANAWHRIAVQYMVWIAWQVAAHRLSDVWSTITNVELAMPCTNLNDVPQGWNDLLFVRSNKIDEDTVTLVNTTIWCTNGFSPYSSDSLVEGLQPLLDESYDAGSGSSKIDVIVIPPNDGLLWDLAWDTTFKCTESHMFRTFMLQFPRWHRPRTKNSAAVLAQHTETQGTKSTTRVVCWILRYGNPQRDIANRDEVHGMLLSIFDTVRLLHITRYHTSLHISYIMDDCEVLYGVHGAGMVNAMWGTISSVERTAVVEVLPHNQPQYFRSVSGLMGHYYEGVLADNLMDDKLYHIDLEKSAEALRRALKYIKQSKI